MAGSPNDRPPSGTVELPDNRATIEAVTIPRLTEIMDTIAAPRTGDSEPHIVDPSPVSFEAGSRYAVRRVLGAGGMGEVRLCKDAWVGREVAMKVMRPGTGSRSIARARFLREARVQGQLEHPSVVPVYDLGRGAEGEDFFTMKRVNGLTLEQIVVGLHEGDPEITQAFSRRKLLSAMSQVCLSVAYAHRRGVVHRDLKPANIMLGDFGEVYVLDWGVAKIQGAAEIDLDDVVSGELHGIAQTEAGSVIGTPGYMSPEQGLGEVAVTPASDVYSLGAMLFEVLCYEPLHRGKTVAALIASTLTQPAVTPSASAPERGIAPELDAICLKALALNPIDRFASALELGEAIERYLDGERDAERRQELAREHLERARQALERAASGGEDASKARSAGMLELSRALALDPTDQGALGMITDLVLKDSGDLPPEAEAELKSVEFRDRALTAIRSSRTLITWVIGVPVFLWMGVRDWKLFGVFWAVVLTSSLGARLLAATGRITPRYMRLVMFGVCAVVVVSSLLFSPFIIAPTVATLGACAYVVGVRANKETRGFAFTLSIMSVVGAYLLQRFGVFPESLVFENGAIKIVPVIVNFPETATRFFLVGATVIQLFVPYFLIGNAVDALVKAERRNFAQAFRLRQLLPGQGLDGSTSTTPTAIACHDQL